MATKEYTISNERSRMGRSSFDIHCPFCAHVSTAYVWSINGVGKLCENERCRARFSRAGVATSRLMDR